MASIDGIQAAKIQALEKAIIDLRQEFDEFRESHGWRSEQPPKTEHQRIAEIFRVTKEIFGYQDVSMQLLQEPRNASDEFMVFHVYFSGDPQDAVRKRIEWHYRVAEIVPDSYFYRISIH